jgi:hypothetical protein
VCILLLLIPALCNYNMSLQKLQERERERERENIFVWSRSEENSQVSIGLPQRQQRERKYRKEGTKKKKRCDAVTDPPPTSNIGEKDQAEKRMDFFKGDCDRSHDWTIFALLGCTLEVLMRGFYDRKLSLIVRLLGVVQRNEVTSPLYSG